jgi:sensor histidine kinase regulating citrate/malate metabolism
MTDEQIVQLLRQVRHEWGNHLQVISGFLDLERADDVRRYIKSLAQDLAEEVIIFEKSSPRVAFYFYQQLLLAREKGIKMSYQDLSVSSIDNLEKNQEPLQSVVKALGSAKDSQVAVAVHQSEKDGIVIYISIDGEPEPVVVSVME